MGHPLRKSYLFSEPLTAPSSSGFHAPVWYPPTGCRFCIKRAHDLVCIMSICDAEQLYTDAALVLDASTRVPAVARSGLIDLHLHCVVNHADELQAASTVLMLGLVRKLSLQVSRGSVTLSSETQMQGSC